MDLTSLFTHGPAAEIDTAPSYLADYKDLYRTDAREAGRQWFREARYGLFLHYGLYAIGGRHEWQQYRECTPVGEYARLQESFTADGFDAMGIVELAIACGMRYVTLTARHHDGFCLWNTQFSDFNSATAPARRDLVGELAVACETHGIGLCLYYSHGRDWRHPHAPNNDTWGGRARPVYDPAEPSYRYGAEHDLERYLDFVGDQIHELLTGYGPVAAIWLDGIDVPRSGDVERFRCQDLYDRIHSLQPQVLVAYRDGLLGTEDFLAPAEPFTAAALDALPPAASKPRELSASMTPGVWGYQADAAAPRLGLEEVWACLAQAGAQDANLAMNSALLPDGSLDERDVCVLLEVGARIEAQGWPQTPAAPPAAKGRGRGKAAGKGKAKARSR